MLHRRRRKRRSPGLSIAPLIDCVFLLLIFFVVTSTMMRDTSHLKIELPAASAEQQPPAGIRVEMPADGSLLVNGDQVEPADLAQALAFPDADRSSTPVVIYSDRSLAVERLVLVMDQVRLAGFQAVSLVTTVGGRP